MFVDRQLVAGPDEPCRAGSPAAGRTGRRLLLGVVALLAFILADAPVRGEAPVDYRRDIKPLLSARCYACHGPDAKARKAELRLDVRESAVESAIVPGDAAESPLLERITSDDADERMPPPRSNKPRLKPREVQLVRRWIDEGAAYDAHWAYVPPTRPPLPDADSAAGPIDRFIGARLRRAELAPAAEADRRTLYRRLSFDLTGLPPRPDDVERFVADDSPHAYAALVDRLLDSPHYGERMAIYWLDVVRYADSNGIHSDKERNVAPYRDYVIGAFNDNMPFDRFCVEQLAGDLLPEKSRQQLIASGHNRMYMTTDEGGAQPKEYLAKYSADRVRNTASIWLGSTMGCSECHDHKFDPFTMRDFYSLAAFFADLEEVAVGQPKTTPVPTDEQAARLKKIDAEMTAARQQLDAPTPELESDQLAWEASLAMGESAWTLLRADDAVSEGGAQLEMESGGAYVVRGATPDKDVYTISLRGRLPGITGLRLELLAHKELPRNGPGRASNGNLVLNELAVTQGGKRLPLSVASALFEQPNYPVASAVDGNPGSGYAVMGKNSQGTPTEAVFALAAGAEPVDGPLTIVLRQQYGSRHTLGHFRLWVTRSAAPPRADGARVPPKIGAILAKPVAERSDAERKELAAHYRGIAPRLEPQRKAVAELEQQKGELQKAFPATLVTRTAKPRMIRILPRGNWLDDSGEVVEPAVPAFLGKLEGKAPRPTRLDLAEWMVARENPLTARVFVNRVWKLFFGRGIVGSLDDFGSQGSVPTHPELLDWLAVDFVEHGWDVKRLVRQIVTSQTYRQSSQVAANVIARDPPNDLLARQARFRLDAEMVRDNALAVSGLLVRTVGGRSVKPYQPAGYWAHLNFPKRTYQQGKGDDLWRRGLYTHWQRTFLHPSLLAFDAPTREECTVARPRSNTPQQALVLLNDPTYVEAARLFADRITKRGDEPAAAIRFAWRETLCRAPTGAEEAILAAILEKHRAQYAKDVDAARKLVAVGEHPAGRDGDPVGLAAWMSVARVLLNLPETITRP